MKRLFCALLCVLMILGALPAVADKPVSEVMVVVKCSEWVSLRKEPFTSSQRLAKVHLGELVTDCVATSSGFVLCSWGGKRGYILEDYLQTTSYTSSDGILPNQMVYNCNEYVSLREKPDTSSTRLIKVPLGAIVTSCVTYSGNFVLCEYKGKKGYVLSKYLKDADYSKPAPTATPKPTAKPTATPVPTYDPLPYYMQVTNCEQWVTLRSEPRTSASALDHVPLDAVVEDCEQVNDSFIKCVYDGKTGYIHKDYLTAYEENASGFDDLDMPSYELFITRGTPVLEQKVNGYTVVVRRSYNGEGEEIMAMCYDAGGKPCWGIWDKSDYATELTMTDALISGENLVLFVTGKGFKAYGIGEWASPVWELKDSEERSFGAGLCKLVADDGTFYVTGYYSSEVSRISPDGKIVWTSDYSDDDVYWPYFMEMGQYGLTVFYDSAENGLVYSVLYDYETGAHLSTTLVPEPPYTTAEVE